MSKYKKLDPTERMRHRSGIPTPWTTFFGFAVPQRPKSDKGEILKNN